MKKFKMHSGHVELAEWYRMAKHNKMVKKPEQKTIDDFHRLGCMRIWSLKGHNNNRNFVV